MINYWIFFIFVTLIAYVIGFILSKSEVKKSNLYYDNTIKSINNIQHNYDNMIKSVDNMRDLIKLSKTNTN